MAILPLPPSVRARAAANAEANATVPSPNEESDFINRLAARAAALEAEAQRVRSQANFDSKIAPLQQSIAEKMAAALPAGPPELPPPPKLGPFRQAAIALAGGANPQFQKDVVGPLIAQFDPAQRQQLQNQLNQQYFDQLSQTSQTLNAQRFAEIQEKQFGMQASSLAMELDKAGMELENMMLNAQRAHMLGHSFMDAFDPEQLTGFQEKLDELSIAATQADNEQAGAQVGLAQVLKNRLVRLFAQGAQAMGADPPDIEMLQKLDEQAAESMGELRKVLNDAADALDPGRGGGSGAKLPTGMMKDILRNRSTLMQLDRVETAWNAARAAGFFPDDDSFSRFYLILRKSISKGLLSPEEAKLAAEMQSLASPIRKEWIGATQAIQELSRLDYALPEFTDPPHIIENFFTSARAQAEEQLRILYDISQGDPFGMHPGMAGAPAGSGIYFQPDFLGAESQSLSNDLYTLRDGTTVRVAPDGTYQRVREDGD